MNRKVFITKYALTRGIIQSEGEIKKYGISTVVSVGPHLFHKGEFFIKKEDAIKRCNELRDKEIKNLEKKIEKLKNLTFE